MREQYTQKIAAHYSSYRPPLHEEILARVLPDEKTFDNGLDVGCGTGYSAVALTKYCSHVYGIEPSRSMLKKAAPQARITYLQGTGENLPLADKSMHVVTFAGSLFYVKSDSLAAELKRVCHDQAIVIAYDFEVLLDHTLSQCGVSLETTVSDYDHEVSFSGKSGFIEAATGSEQIDLEITAPDLAHVLLSYCYEAFVEQYDASDPFLALAKELERQKTQHRLQVNIYFSKYRLDQRRQ